MANACAYCGVEKALTREHVWPKGLITRVDYNLRYSEKTNKVFSGDLIIKDVCADCNNGSLSKLDDYGVALYDSNLGRFDRPRESVLFEYDYGQLSRWLLKISYNASRGSGLDSDILGRYAPILIAGGECCPLYLAIYVGRIAPARKPNGTLLKPSGYRCGRLQVAGGAFERWCTTRVVLINTYLFSMVILREPITEPKIIAPLMESLYGVPLDTSGRVTIPAPTIDTFNAFSGIEKWPVRR